MHRRAPNRTLYPNPRIASHPRALRRSEGARNPKTTDTRTDTNGAFSPWVSARLVGSVSVRDLWTTILRMPWPFFSFRGIQLLNWQLSDSRRSELPSVGRLKHGANRQPCPSH